MTLVVRIIVLATNQHSENYFEMNFVNRQFDSYLYNYLQSFRLRKYANRRFEIHVGIRY